MTKYNALSSQKNSSVYHDWDIDRTLVTSYAKRIQETDELRKSFSIPLNKMLISCDFNGFACSSADFEWYFDAVLGNCYRFNSGINSTGHVVPEKTVSNTGLLGSLVLELVMPKPIPKFYSFAKSLGAQVFIHNRTIIPSAYQGFAVPIGTQTEIAVNRQYVEKMPKPYSDCISDIESFNSVFTKHFVKNNITYRQKSCFEYCYQRRVIDRCKFVKANILSFF
jgi:hypothetical protein